MYVTGAAEQASCVEPNDDELDEAEDEGLLLGSSALDPSKPTSQARSWSNKAFNSAKLALKSSALKAKLDEPWFLWNNEEPDDFEPERANVRFAEHSTAWINDNELFLTDMS